MKFLFLIAALLLAGVAWGKNDNPVIVLIQPANVSHLAAETSHDGPWILWPPKIGDHLNQLLSIPTGLDWTGDKDDYLFKKTDGGWISSNYASFRDRGDTWLRRPPLGVLQIRDEPSIAVLLLGIHIGSPSIRVTRLDQVWPKGPMVAQAASWDEVSLVRRSTHGRVLVVEYPPAPDLSASRVWLFGPWPMSAEGGLKLPSVPNAVPSLIPARSIKQLLLNPTAFQWSSSARPNDAAEWLAFQSGFGLTCTYLIGGLAGLILMISALAVMTEHRSAGLSGAIRLAVAAPAGWYLAIACGMEFGIQAIPFIAAVLIPLVALAARWIEVIIVSHVDNVHSVWVTAWLSLLVFALIPIFWSLVVAEILLLVSAIMATWLTPRFGLPRYVRWIPWILLVPFAIQNQIYDNESAMLLLCLFPIFVQDRQYLVMFAIIQVTRPLFHTTSQPIGLIQTSSDIGNLSGWVYVQNLSSPTLIATMCSIGLLTLFGDKYLFHRFQRRAESDFRIQKLFHICIWTAIFSVSYPPLIQVAIGVFLVTSAAVLYDELALLA
ncbi:hypothetical protein BH11ARM1_BH11ARM1_05460 [soil metagenome]